MPLDRRRHVLFYGFIAPCTLGMATAFAQVFCLFANDRSSASHSTGGVLGQVFFLFFAVGVILAIAGVSMLASGGLAYFCWRSRHAVWLGWLPWIVAAALFGSFALASP